MQDQEAVIYRIPISATATDLGRLRTVLSKEENAKADRFVVDPPRIQFVTCRWALRTVLAASLGCRPDEVVFSYSRWGKPNIDLDRTPIAKSSLETAQSLQFNVSHSGDFGLIAVSDRAIGVDIERLQPRINAKSLRTQVVSPHETSQWESLAASQLAEQILRLWVCKEAVLKAMGLGIAECLQQISFSLPIPSGGAFKLRHVDPSVQLHLDEPGNCRCHSWISANSWLIQPLAISPDYFAAVAIAASQTPNNQPPSASFRVIDFEDG